MGRPEIVGSNCKDKGHALPNLVSSRTVLRDREGRGVAQGGYVALLRIGEFNTRDAAAYP